MSKGHQSDTVTRVRTRRRERALLSLSFRNSQESHRHFAPRANVGLSPCHIRDPLTTDPRCNVNLVDLTLNLVRPTSRKNVIRTLENASESSLKGVLRVENVELVSCDFQGNPYSCVIDAEACVELNSRLVSVTTAPAFY